MTKAARRVGKRPGGTKTKVDVKDLAPPGLHPHTFVDKNDEKALRDFTDCPSTLLLYTAEGQSVSLENWYRGRPVFLVCGGPSLGDMDLTQLKRPGIITFGVNNVWAAYRPNLWCCVDRPGNFLDTGWKDPAILKFAPLGKVDTHLHLRRKDGGFKKSTYKLKNMPSVLYFRRNEKFDAEHFLTQGTVNWGCHGRCTDHLGIKGSRSVMLAAMRLIHYLGFRTVYIIGADFKMVQSPQDKAAKNYAWQQWRHNSSVSGNNATYASLNRRFDALLPVFKETDLSVFNCTPDSGLKSFPTMDYQKAVDTAAEECEKEVSTEGWYNHDSKM